MSKDPAFLMYSKDWLEGTAEYMPDEKGVYIDLLCYQHQRGYLPIETERLAKMVGLSHNIFLKIWAVISCHFKQTDNRLVNRKLKVVMDERAEKSKMNTITGTFASLLRFGNYSAKQYKHLKTNFKPNNFIKYNKECITERLTEWLVLCLKSIEDEDVNGINNYKGVLSKILIENKIQLPEGFESLIIEWLKYKAEKGQSYKETGLKTFINSFLKRSNSDVKVGREMLNFSMSQNYAGLYKNNYNENNTGNNQRRIKSVNKLWDKED